MSINTLSTAKMSSMDKHTGQVISLVVMPGIGCSAVTDPAVEFHPADIGQIVALRREEQIVQQALGGVLGRRLTRAHHPVDFHLGIPLTAGGIGAQGIGNDRGRG
jgi:hypothetical protein